MGEKLQAARLVASRRPDGVEKREVISKLRRSLVGSRRPDGVKYFAIVTLIRGAASRSQLPSWDTAACGGQSSNALYVFANKLAKPQLGSWGLL